MKGVIPALLVLTLMSVSAGAQDSKPMSHSDANQTAPMTQQGSTPMDDSAMAAATDPPASPAASPADVQNGYSSGDYSGRAEIFLSGYSVFGNQTNGNGIA